jgi:hypothetical protein
LEKPANNRRQKRIVIACVVGGLLVLGAIIVIWQQTHKPKPIHDFAGCVEAGYPVADSFPETCTVPKVGTFINPDQHVDTTTGPVKTNINFTTLVISQGKGPTEKKQVVITNQADWEKYWKAAHSFLPVLPPLIAVNFKTDMVVAAQAGPQVSTGYNYQITSISEDDHGVSIEVHLNTPGKGCQPKEPPTMPYHIVKAARNEKPVEFHTVTKAIDCLN